MTLSQQENTEAGRAVGGSISDPQRREQPGVGSITSGANRPLSPQNGPRVQEESFCFCTEHWE